MISVIDYELTRSRLAPIMPMRRNSVSVIDGDIAFARAP
jgi:hypothetical protein